MRPINRTEESEVYNRNKNNNSNNNNKKKNTVVSEKSTDLKNNISRHVKMSVIIFTVHTLGSKIKSHLVVSA